MKIVIDRIRTGVQSKLKKEQAGFTPGRGTTKQIFILRNIIEQSIEWQSTLYVNLIDFEKTFDDSLWPIMRSYCIPPKCAVLDREDTMEWLKNQTGVKQGCYMSGFLFLLECGLGTYMSYIAKGKHRNRGSGIR